MLQIPISFLPVGVPPAMPARTHPTSVGRITGNPRWHVRTHLTKYIDQANWKFAHRIFQCVAVASRPLRVEELAEVLAFDFDVGPTPAYRASWCLEDPVRAVLFTCSSLLTVVKFDDSELIKFSHFSVKEFLTSTRLAEASDIISRYHVSITAAHSLVAQVCLGILLHLDENITSNRLKNFPLAEYAAERWVDHADFCLARDKCALTGTTHVTAPRLSDNLLLGSCAATTSTLYPIPTQHLFSYFYTRLFHPYHE
jgi:hypothetical protein